MNKYALVQVLTDSMYDGGEKLVGQFFVAKRDLEVDPNGDFFEISSRLLHRVHPEEFVNDNSLCCFIKSWGEIRVVSEIDEKVGDKIYNEKNDDRVYDLDDVFNTGGELNCNECPERYECDLFREEHNLC